MLQPRRDAWMSALRERGEQELAELREAGYVPGSANEA
jgi:hypothetical protein